MRSLTLTPEPVVFDDPASLDVVAAANVTVDGKLDEAEWANAPTLLFGPGAYLKRTGKEKTVTGDVDVKGTFVVNGVTYHLPNIDSSLARVKFLRKGMNLYIGFQSDDKSVGTFGDSWEGDGLFMKIKYANGATKEFKLYYNLTGAVNGDTTIHYEANDPTFGAGASVKGTNTKVNDTTQVDNGYTAELVIHLDSLGYIPNAAAIPVLVNIFDPDGYPGNKLAPWDSARGTYYKSWWGSEWGPTMRSLNITPLPPAYDNPDTIFAKDAVASIVVDGNLNEADWTTANTLVFGPSNAPKNPGEKTVTGNVDVKASFVVNGVTYLLPYKDTSFTRVKFLHKGMNLYIGIQSSDKSVGSFGDSWEGDGMFMKMKYASGAMNEFKSFYRDSAGVSYEATVLKHAKAAGKLGASSKVNDTTQVDNGYSMETVIYLDSLGYNKYTKSVQALVNIFDPDGFTRTLAPWDSARGTYFKSWWGSEWGPAMKTIAFSPVTGVGANAIGGVPTVYSLAQNYPNPFNPTTNIQFGVPENSFVELKIYDILGREVATLASGNYVAGFYTLPFNGSSLSSSVYFYRMTSRSIVNNQAQFISTKKFLLVK
jgi:hypothetical protein